MKKLLALLLAAVMVFSLAACGAETPAPAATEAPAVTEAPAETETPADPTEEPAAETVSFTD